MGSLRRSFHFSSLCVFVLFLRVFAFFFNSPTYAARYLQD